MNGSASGPRFHTLDVIRGLAALAVVVQHVLRSTPGLDSLTFWTSPAHNAWWVRWVFLGEMAVTVFFVLSGASLAISARQERVFTASSFYIKRLFRIYPLYVLCILVYFAFRPMFHVLSPGARGIWLEPQFTDPVSLGAWISYLSMTFNVLGPTALFNNVLWSLPIEMQFYLFFPLILGLLHMRPSAIGVAWVVILVAGMYLTATLLHLPGATLNRLWEFAAGTTLGFFAGTFTLPSKHRRARGVTLLLLAAAFFYVSRAGKVLPLPLAPSDFFEVCFAITVTALGLHFGGWHASSAMQRALVRLGVISYGVYVWHVLALALLAPAMQGLELSRPVYVLLLLVGAVTVAVGISEVSYRWFEYPLIAAGKGIAARMKGAPPEPVPDNSAPR